MGNSAIVGGVCASLADGDSIDWGTLDDEARDDDARDRIEQLQIIADVAIAYRAIGDAGPARPVVANSPA